MSLSNELKYEISEFLKSIPNIQDPSSQRALIYNSGLDDDLKNQIEIGRSTAHFVTFLIEALVSYGTLKDGREALEAVLETGKSYVGQDRKIYCETLIHAIRNSKANHSVHSSQYKPINHKDKRTGNKWPKNSYVTLALWGIGIIIFFVVVNNFSGNRTPQSMLKDTNLLINGDFSQHWSTGWEKGLEYPPSQGNIVVSNIQSPGGIVLDNQQLYLKLNGANTGWIQQAVRLPQERTLKDLYIVADIQLNSSILSDRAVSFLGIRLEDPFQVLGTLIFSNTKDLMLDGENPKIKGAPIPTETACIIKMEEGYPQIQLNIYEKVLDCLSGFNPDDVRKVTVAGVVKGTTQNSSAEVYLDNVRLYYAK